MNTSNNLEKDQFYQKPAMETVQIELEGPILNNSEIPVEDEGDYWP